MLFIIKPMPIYIYIYIYMLMVEGHLLSCEWLTYMISITMYVNGHVLLLVLSLLS